MSINKIEEEEYIISQAEKDSGNNMSQETVGKNDIDETKIETDKGTYEKSTAGCRHRRFVLDTDTGKVGCAEVLIDALKCLINLSHHCNDSCCSIFDGDGIRILASYLDTLYSIRHRLNDRRIIELKSQSSSLFS